MEDEKGGVHVMDGREHKRIRVLEKKPETNSQLTT
jgi:hypothetical protein